MGWWNSQNETDESDSTYENEEGGSGMSNSSVSLEEEVSTSSNGRLWGEMRSKKMEDRGEREARMQKDGSKGHAGWHGR